MAENDSQVGGDHYRQGGKFTQQHWDYTWERKFDQFQYVITKYVERWKLKAGLQDLYKARQYLNKYIELVEAEAAKEAVVQANAKLRAAVVAAEAQVAA